MGRLFVNLTAVCYQVSINEEDIKKNGFIEPSGTYVFNRRIFGHSGAPNPFRKMIDTVL